MEAFFGYFRDWVVCALPIAKLPKPLVKLLYGTEIKFAFLVHPRFLQDSFISLPFLEPTKFLLRRRNSYNFLSKTSPFILNSVRTKQGVRGIVVAQLTLPEVMFAKRKETQAQLEKMVRFVGRIAAPNAVVGLGGWFPMISRRGTSLEEAARKSELLITNGHCGTLASIYMMTEKIAAIAGLKFSDLNVAVIGVGKMGSNVAKAFHGKVKMLTLIDINENNLTRTKNMLDAEGSKKTFIASYRIGQTEPPIREILKRHHIGVCAASSLRNVLKLKDIPTGFIAIDDSRPEAIPRDPRKERIILEGGLLKIEGASIDYNFGFGEDDNVFGCLGEAFVVALDSRESLAPTLGNVDMNNFFRFMELCKKNGVRGGDFKSGSDLISEDDIRAALKKRELKIHEGSNRFHESTFN